MMMHSRLRLLLLLLAVAAATTGQAQLKKSYYYPAPGVWQHHSPAAEGMDSALLDQAVQFAIGSESKGAKDLKLDHYETAFGREPFNELAGPMKDRGPCSGLIIRNGYIIVEWGDPGRVDLTFSEAKSFLSTVAGVAFDEKLIRDVHDKVGPYMAPVIPYEPVIAPGSPAEGMGKKDVIDLFETEHNRKITWDHLLRQTSDWEGTLWGKPDWADRPTGNASEWASHKHNEPGTVYKYNDTRVNVLALALLNIWRKPLPQVLKEKIMDPIGASCTWRWTGYNNSWIVLDGQLVQSVSGGSHFGGGLFINSYDQARFGYLTLRNGRWNDKQLISEAWLKMARTPTPVQPGYGFMNFFLNTDKKLYPSAPATAFTHIGAGSNIIYVDQENDIIIVARWIEGNAVDGVIKRVLVSIKK
ncbi:MAG TPA: serine hydrolase [Chitinophagaceae bacterium]|jgi:CubicO group peptidase (beta-lactamase class C family)